MDMDMIQQSISWVQGNIGDVTTKQEVVSKVQNSNLPSEAKSAFQDLPEGELSKDSILQHLRAKAMAGVGGGMGGSQGGGMGGMFGGE
jgi:hypothetical protein